MRRCSVLLVCLGLLAACGGESTDSTARRPSKKPTAKRLPPARELVHFSSRISRGVNPDAYRAPYSTVDAHDGVHGLTLAETNERLVVTALEQIVFAQRVAMHHNYVDANGDGKGEPLLLGEILGAVPVRNTDREFEGNRDLLARFDSRIAIGRARYAGYLFQVWLRGKNGDWVTDGSAVEPAADREWCCYAWPVHRGQSGRLAYFVDNSGEILASPNLRRMYEGHELTPEPDAARGERTVIEGGAGAHDGDSFMGSDRGRWARVTVYVPPVPPK